MSFGTAFAGVAVTRRAELSPCGTWRYTLDRVWSEAPVLPCCLLNPSFADAERDDNTVKVLMAYSKGLGFGGITIVNPWALVSTAPAGLKSHPDPIGPDNDWHLTEAFIRAREGIVLCGWGDGGAGQRTDSLVREIVNCGARPVCIAVTKSGNPGHPLRKRLPSKPFEWRAA